MYVKWLRRVDSLLALPTEQNTPHTRIADMAWVDEYGPNIWDLQERLLSGHNLAEKLKSLAIRVCA